MKKFILLIIMLKTTAIFLTGCGPSPETTAALKELSKKRPDTDLTPSPEYNFSSFAGTVWKTKVELALAEVKLYTGRRELALLTPENFEPTHPKYRPVHDSSIIATLPTGTKLRIERLMKDNGIAGLLWVTATIEVGTNAQKIVHVDADMLAKNRFIWPGWSSSTNWDVNPEMLEAVAEK